VPNGRVRAVPADSTLAVLGRAADAVAEAIAKQKDWLVKGDRDGQYRIDLVADEAALGVLLSAGFDVLSEESGLSTADGKGMLAVVDPIDGSTNAARGISYFATSICVVDEHGPLCALVVNQAQESRYEATRGKGATRDGRVIKPSKTAALSDAVVGISGMPHQRVAWRQFRAFGAAALDLCAVADGRLDGFVEWGRGSLGVWDYLGGVLICREAGAHAAEAHGLDLLTTEHADRRSPIAAGTKSLLDQLLAARAT